MSIDNIVFHLIFLLITTNLVCCAENRIKKYLNIIDYTCLAVAYGLIKTIVFRETKINEQQSPLETIPELSQVLTHPICQVSIKKPIYCSCCPNVF